MANIHRKFALFNSFGPSSPVLSASNPSSPALLPGRPGRRGRESIRACDAPQSRFSRRRSVVAQIYQLCRTFQPTLWFGLPVHCSPSDKISKPAGTPPQKCGQFAKRNVPVADIRGSKRSSMCQKNRQRQRQHPSVPKARPSIACVNAFRFAIGLDS